MGNTTWEPHEACKDLQALDDYLGLIGIQDPHNLPCKGKPHECVPFVAMSCLVRLIKRDLPYRNAPR